MLAHIVTFNSAESVTRSIRSLLEQEAAGTAITVRVTDNASSNNIISRIEREFESEIEIRRNEFNLGFSGAHNQAATDVVNGDFDYLLIVNPDLRLERNAVKALLSAIEQYDDVGSACPLLYRADDTLCQTKPAMIDAAGMYMTPELRHFDRGSGENDDEQYHRHCFVFGGSGACLLLRKRFISDVCIERGRHEALLESISLGLSQGALARLQLFDEAFLAYREDADLAWRAQLYGWRCLFVPEALGYHTRVVVPERRSQLAPELNRYSVRNRFLMQLNNFSLGCGVQALIQGVVWRNLLVLCGVILKEQSSLQAIKDVVRLLARSMVQRRHIAAKVKRKELKCWFAKIPFTEPL